jgi:hypothetical protein
MMSIEIPPRDPIGRERRKAVATRRQADQPRCVECGEDRPAALVAKSKPRRCAKCLRRRHGKSTLDRHHPPGRANHPLTIPVPVNDHRTELSEAQYDWSVATLDNPDRDPLLRGAACIRGFVDTLIYAARELLLWIAEFLEKLSAYLVEQFGRAWWRKTPLNAFTYDPKRLR